MNFIYRMTDPLRAVHRLARTPGSLEAPVCRALCVFPHHLSERHFLPPLACVVCGPVLPSPLLEISICLP